MTSNHTPPPWFIYGGDVMCGTPEAPGQPLVPVLSVEENRPLIAAAPVLYEFVLARAVAGDKDAVRVLQSFSKG